MLVRLDIPQRVFERRVLVARHFLLLEPPLGQLDAVREEVAAREVVAEPEVGPDRSEVLARLAVLVLLELDDPDVVTWAAMSVPEGQRRAIGATHASPANPSNPYPLTSFWKSTSLIGGLTSCEWSRFWVVLCWSRICALSAMKVIGSWYSWSRSASPGVVMLRMSHSLLVSLWG